MTTNGVEYVNVNPILKKLMGLNIKPDENLPKKILRPINREYISLNMLKDIIVETVREK